jgi:hypothetical protein
MMRRVILTAVLLLSPLSWAAAQGDPAQRIVAARQQAVRTGIPVALLDGKIAEGRAKNIPEDRIAAAVEHRLASLERARAAMGGGAHAPAIAAADLNVGADALDAGVDPAVLGRLAQAAAPDRRTVAIAVLAELVQQGLSSADALARVTAALAKGSEALRQLPGEARSNRRGSSRENDQGNDDQGNHDQGNHDQGNHDQGNHGQGSNGNGHGSARRGPPDGHGPADGNAHGGRAHGGGPPSSVPGPGGKGRGHGNGHGHDKP